MDQIWPEDLWLPRNGGGKKTQGKKKKISFRRAWAKDSSEKEGYPIWKIDVRLPNHRSDGSCTSSTCLFVFDGLPSLRRTKVSGTRSKTTAPAGFEPTWIIRARSTTLSTQTIKTLFDVAQMAFGEKDVVGFCRRKSQEIALEL